MRYLHLKKDSDIIKVEKLPRSGAYHQTIHGELIHILDDKLYTFLPKGSWAIEEEKPKPKPNPLTRRFKMSPELSEICGATVLTRPQIVKGLWDFIRKHDLQAQDDKRMIDVGKHPLTKTMFRAERVSMFQLVGVVNRNLFDLKGKKVGIAK